jgi:Flp pilus assembly protein TadD
MRGVIPLLAVAVLASPVYAQPRWTVVRSETLTVIGDQARTVREIATELEQFREAAGQLVGTTHRPALPTVVYVFNTRRAMEPYLPLYNGRPRELAGLYAPDIDVGRILMTTEFREQSTAIAYHEYMHLVVGNAVRGMPVWLNEGIAEYFGTFRLTSNGRSAEAGHPKAEHILLLREQFIPIMELLETQHTSRLYNEGDRRNIFYAESWALTHYILSQPNGGAAINRFLNGVNNGVPVADAVRDAFGATPAELEAKLRAYVRRELFSMMRYQMSQRVTATTASTPRTLSPLEAEGWLGDLQRAVHGPEAAAARIEAAADKGPDVAIVQLALGRLRARQGRHGDARAALARAAAAAPDDFIMQLAHGMWLASGGRLETSDEVVASLRRATALNPQSAEAHAWLATNLMTSPATRAEARAAIDRAITLAPGRLDYVVHLAEIYLLDDMLAQARSLLGDVVANGRDPRAVASARARLATIEMREQALARREAIRAELEASVAAAARAGAASAAATSAPGASPETTRDTASRSLAERTGALDVASLRAASTATPLVHAQSGETRLLMMRRVKADEQRIFATLINVECRQGPELRFHLVDGARTIIATAGRFTDVELTAFRSGELLLSCGRRSPADPVALTYKPTTTTPGIIGAAVALDFLPDGFGPQ